jgi:HAD superfamily hydrolase (TIGR01450 family)
MVWVLDLDGVVWLAEQPIPGAPGAVERLRAAGERVVFVTNNSSARIAEQEAALEAIGIPAAGDVFTSAGAAAALLASGARVVVCGGPGVAEAAAGIGAVPVDGDDEAGTSADAVVVGFHRNFDYERLRIAATAVRNGAALIGTNDDATYPTPDGPIPGGGAILAAVATAAGVSPVVAGKPHRPMAEAVLDQLGRPEPATVLVVGDRPSTDGLFAVTLGSPFALVRTGVTGPGDSVDLPVAIDAPDLAAVVDALDAVESADR